MPESGDMRGAGPRTVSVMHGGLDERRYADLLQALEHPEMGPAVEAFYAAIADSGLHKTMLRDEVDPEGRAYQSGPNELWEKADIGPVMLSGFPLDAKSLSAIAIYRRLGAAHFTERDPAIGIVVVSDGESGEIRIAPKRGEATVRPLRPLRPPRPPLTIKT